MRKLSKIKHYEELELALLEQRIIFLHKEVNTYTVNSTLIQLAFLQSASKQPIILNINSPGGSVDSGLALYDAIKSSKAPVYTQCTGLAASMGAVLLGAGKKGHRTANKHARIMIHQPSGGFIGKSSDIENYASEISRMRKSLNQLIANDTGQSIKKVSADTDRDYFLTAEEAKAYGIIDKIV